MRRRAAVVACGTGGVAAGVLALTVTTLPTATSCTTHQCDLSTVALGGNAGDGEGGPFGTLTYLPDGEVRWESSSLDGKWLEFPGERTYVMQYLVSFANTPVPTYLIAADFVDAQANFVVGAANLAQLSNASTKGVTFLNPVCTDYGLYVSVQGFPAASDADAGDDGGLEDAPGLPDADAGNDAGLDDAPGLPDASE